MVGATVAGILIAIVAFFVALLNPIATAGGAAVVEAGIHLIFVAVVAGLIVIVTEFEIAPCDAITTFSCGAVVAAGVEIVVITIIAAFAFIDDGVATEIGSLGTIGSDSITAPTGNEKEASEEENRSCHCAPKISFS